MNDIKLVDIVSVVRISTFEVEKFNFSIANKNTMCGVDKKNSLKCK